jgi:hypothetical protein
MSHVGPEHSDHYTLRDVLRLTSCAHPEEQLFFDQRAQNRERHFPRGEQQETHTGALHISRRGPPHGI